MQVHFLPLEIRTTGTLPNGGNPTLVVNLEHGAWLTFGKDEARRLRDDIDRFLTEADSPIDGAHAASVLDEERDNSDDDTMLLAEAEAREVLGEQTPCGKAVAS